MMGIYMHVQVKMNLFVQRVELMKIILGIAIQMPMTIVANRIIILLPVPDMVKVVFPGY